MVNDELGLLFRAADLNTSSNGFSSNGNDLNIGRGGIPTRSQLVTYVGKANVDRTLNFNYYLSLNNDTFRQIAVITYPPTFKGKRTLNIGMSLPWQKWVDAEIMLRCSVTASNHANASDWDKVSSYLGSGEETVFGRAAGASDTLVDA